MSRLGWSPESHHEFPLLFRRGVRHILGLMWALNAQRHTEGKAHIQQDTWHLIISHLPCNWELDFDENGPHWSSLVFDVGEPYPARHQWSWLRSLRQ